MSKRSQTLRALVTERLTAAAEEIFELVERTIAEYEEELCRSKEENQRQKQQQEQVLLHGFQINLPTQDDAEPSRHQDIPETPLIKEEPEEPSVKQEDEQLPQFTETPPKTDNIVITKVSSLCDVSEKQNHAEAGSVRTVPTTRTQTPDTPAQMETEADGDRDPSHRNKPETRAGGKHECPFCTKSFMSKQKLETHVRVHTGQRPFSCSICAKTFARKDHLDVHMRTHTGERAHSCSEAPSGGSSSATGSTVKFNVQYREKKTHMNLNGRSYSTFLTEGFTEANDTATPGAGRGQTWSTAEISCLLEVWADDFINAQLSTTHKNSAIYAVFSKRLRAKGYSRSISQCRIKAKKLRAEYIKTRDAITKGGADESIKDKFPWYDQMDDILAQNPKWTQWTWWRTRSTRSMRSTALHPAAPQTQALMRRVAQPSLQKTRAPGTRGKLPGRGQNLEEPLLSRSVSLDPAPERGSAKRPGPRVTSKSTWRNSSRE
uniref:C2H2-type domain-containing protein n=1 Tax=Neogobius melanostomus TaxID=47308 RepID=A0A8C6WRK9_9GOBI